MAKRFKQSLFEFYRTAEKLCYIGTLFVHFLSPQYL